MTENPPLRDGGPKSVKRIAIEQHNLSADFSSPSRTKNKSSARLTKRRARPKAITATARLRRRRELAIYDGVNLVGIVKVAADGKSTAYDARGKRLGLFPTFQAASAAFDKPSAPGVAGWAVQQIPLTDETAARAVKARRALRRTRLASRR